MARMSTSSNASSSARLLRMLLTTLIGLGSNLQQPSPSRRALLSMTEHQGHSRPVVVTTLASFQELSR